MILERYDLCEDMAQMLCQPSLNMMGSMNITETDVLDRTLQGLLINPDIVSPSEAKWVLQRMSELLNWNVADLPALLDQLQDAFSSKSTSLPAAHPPHTP